MRMDVTLVREPTDWSLPKDLLVPVERPNHRPTDRFRRIRLDTPEDVERARKSHLPVSLLEPKLVTNLSYPMNFRPRLLVAREIRAVLDSTYPLVNMASAEAAREPTLEDLVVAMLHVDTLAARAIALRNRDHIDPNRLLKRVLQDDAEQLATLVRLQEIAPAIPIVGRALPADQLNRHDRKNPAHHGIP
ncbi:MAG: hypothetical protein WCB19_02535 [Thermoplasmata archaeon]